MPTQIEDPLLDRRQIAALSLEVLGPGARVSVNRINKEAMRGNGPPIDFYLGPKELSRESRAVSWLRSLLRPGPAAQATDNRTAT